MYAYLKPHAVSSNQFNMLCVLWTLRPTNLTFIEGLQSSRKPCPKILRTSSHQAKAEISSNVEPVLIFYIINFNSTTDKIYPRRII